VKDFPFYATRLEDQDYKKIIERGTPFEDAMFPADKYSILDKTMSHSGH